MKKLLYLSVFSIIISLSACNSSTQKTGGAVSDSGNHGSSGPADTAMAAGSGSPVGVTTTGTDTSKNGKSTTNPTVDSNKTKKQ